MRHRVWCEMLPYDELPAQLPLLARHRVDLLVAVRPWQLDAIGDVVCRARDAGVFTAVWPMLADGDGRWANARSCDKFIELADRLLDVIAASGGKDADELVIDLEPPILQLAKWKDGRPARLQARHYGDARDTLAAATRRWRTRLRVTTAVMPMLAFEIGGQWMQRVLGTPVTPLAVDRHSVMAYSSLLEGWSRGLVDRRRAERLLAACAARSRRRFGDAAALSIGCVGTGAFGDEPCYREPAELARDVELARAAGIDELSLFDLGGVVRRGAEAWLAAFTGSAYSNA